MKKTKGFSPLKGMKSLATTIKDKIEGENMPRFTMTPARKILTDMECASCLENPGPNGCGPGCPPHTWDIKKTNTLLKWLSRLA